MCCFEATTSFGSLISCSCYGFQKRPKSASNDGFIDDGEVVVLYDLYASKNLDFSHDSYAPFDLEEFDESESFAEFRFGKRDIRILKEFCKSLTRLPAVSALFVMD